MSSWACVRLVCLRLGLGCGQRRMLPYSWVALLASALSFAGGEDRSPNCPGWAASGACEDNPAYMLQECADTCAARKVANCNFWAEQGECEKNKVFMQAMCQESCLEPAPDETFEAAVVPDDPALSHPGGPRCYYDALAEGCPSSISVDGKTLLCSCMYNDNAWFHVWNKFVTAFATRYTERHTLGDYFGAKLDGEGVISIEVGLPERVQCGSVVSSSYPGMRYEVETDSLYRMLGSFIYPEVRYKFLEICLPGRLALQLICQHVFIHGIKDFSAAKEYALRIQEIYSMVEGCVDDQSPFPFPGLKKFLATWLATEGFPHRSRMAWYPDQSLMRAKTQEEAPGQNYFPCLPLNTDCFPAGSPSDYSSCEVCCNPEYGPQGNAACFDAHFTFARCCNTLGNSGRFW